ncbi:MAG: hypothetical protein RRB22_07710 [Gammaproteobacteria bacterium]|nr:hypothetical protein [Gammaproteobacteria bacterium]
MNWVEWNSNGMVRIKERSLATLLWRCGKQGERQWCAVIRGLVGVARRVCHPRVLVARDRDVPGLNAGAQPAAAQNVLAMPGRQTHPVTSQAQTANSGSDASQRKTGATRPMGTLTEIRCYTGNRHGIRHEIRHGNMHGAIYDAVQSTDQGGDGQGGLQPLLPALAGYCSDRWLVLVSPPRRPDATELAAAGIDPSRVLLVHARHANGADDNGLKVVEQALQSGTCGAVVAWLEACDMPAMQRLRRAAVVGQAWGVMLLEGETDGVMSVDTLPARGAQVVDIHSGAGWSSGGVRPPLGQQGQGIIQLEMAIN